MKDLYKILGLSESADEAAIKKSYRKLAKQYHPDVTGGDKKKTERFKEINEAYAVLGDAQKRREYDRLKHAPIRPDGMPEGFDPEEFARTFGGGGGRPGGRGGIHLGGEFVDMGEIFASLFGDAARREGGGGRGPGDGWARSQVRQSRGSDVLGTLEVTLVEAALGTRRKVRSASGGEVEVQVPAGVETGGRLRVAGQGAGGSGKNAVPGDLYLDIVVQPHPHLRRNGPDIELELPVTVAEAALGARVEVPTVEGPVTLTVPAGTSSGARLRLRGRGMKKADGTRGDQICRVEIVAPKIMFDDHETRRLMEEIARRTTTGPVRKF
jgi:curved DNA-binding protein